MRTLIWAVHVTHTHTRAAVQGNCVYITPDVCLAPTDRAYPGCSVRRKAAAETDTETRQRNHMRDILHGTSV